MGKNNSFPKYSILMSVYYKENPEWLCESIDSMLKQTVLCDEFVIVEDGPLTEELDKIIEKYEEEYPGIFKIVKIEKNGGLGPALKLGVENCKNEWIVRADSDDYSVPDRCEKQLQYILDNPKTDIIGSNQAEFMDNIENLVSVKRFPTSDEDIKKYSRRRNPFSHSAVIYRKSKVLQAGNYREYYFCEDYDMWIRMIENGAVCANIDETLNYVRVGEDLYKRRGGIKYLKSILKFKTEQYKKGYYSLKDYLISSGAHIISCLVPNIIREKIYTKFLRNK